MKRVIIHQPFKDLSRKYCGSQSNL